MKNLKTTLKQKLLKAEKVALLGVGSELRGDDMAGLVIAEELQKFSKSAVKNLKFRVFIGATAPENLTAEIKRFQPTHLIIIDSSDLEKKAGTISFIKPEDVGGYSFFTHKLPLKIMIDYLLASISCKIIVIGIQPKGLDFDSQPSKEMKKAAKDIVAAFKEILKLK
jgi:hydrogenase 3 maturation protease